MYLLITHLKILMHLTLADKIHLISLSYSFTLGSILFMT